MRALTVDEWASVGGGIGIVQPTSYTDEFGLDDPLASMSSSMYIVWGAERDESGNCTSTGVSAEMIVTAQSPGGVTARGLVYSCLSTAAASAATVAAFGQFQAVPVAATAGCLIGMGLHIADAHPWAPQYQ